MISEEKNKKRADLIINRFTRVRRAGGGGGLSNLRDKINKIKKVF